MYNYLPPAVDWLMILPVTIVVATGVIGLIIEMFARRRSNNAVVGVSLIGLCAAAASLVPQFGMAEAETFGGMVLRDRASLVLQLALVGTTFLAFLFSEGYLREKRIAFAEFYPLALWSAAGGMIMVSTKSLLMVFVGLEVLSVALYVMAGMSRQESKSEESAIKYFLLGAFASGFLLYGIAFVYGATGGVHLDLIARGWNVDDPTTRGLLLFGVGLMLVGLGFKSAFVPFHQWTPDVYQGAPTNVTAFMAAGSKVAAIGALYRVLEASLPLKDLWFPALFWIAILTMTVGNLIALTQKDVKRVLAYSSISNAGYVLVAILAHANAPDKVSVATTVFFLLSYALMTVGAFAVVTLAAKSGREGTRFSDLHGLWKRHPFAAGVLIVFVASLIGVPPTGGFFAKLFIFQDALSAGLAPLAILLAVNSAISVYYYLGIVLATFVEDEGAVPNENAPLNFGLTSAFVLCAAGVLGLMFLITPITTFFGALP